MSEHPDPIMELVTADPVMGADKDGLMTTTQRTCSWEGGCDKPHHARGYCHTHGQQLRDAGLLQPLEKPTTEQRFRSHVDKDGPVHPILGTHCWLWTAATGSRDDDGIGYGRFRLDDHLVQAHRWSFAQASGMFWPGFLELFQIDHRCHNTLCVRPDHLRPATNKQNMEHRRGAQRNSQSGVRGVFWHKQKNCWIAQFTHNGKYIHVGSFVGAPPPAAPPPEAVAALIAARCEVFTHNDLDRAVAI